MSHTLEIEAKNIDQAVQKACRRLNLSPEELEYDILSYGSTGIFGLGRSRKARIRVRLNKDDPGTDQTGRRTPAEDSPGSVLAGADSVTAQQDISPRQAAGSGETDTLVNRGRSLLQRIVDTITDDARIDVEKQTERIVFRVEGGNSAILIGKHGQTLEAIQTLVDKVVNKNSKDRIRVQVDVGGYLQNRKKRLIRNAERLAQKCERTRRPVSAGLLNGYDRRIIHIALKDNHNVRTRSTGDGVQRNLLILPRKTAESRQRKR